jgi:hypothetical protein
MLGFFTLISFLYYTNANELNFRINFDECYGLEKESCVETFLCKWCNISNNDTYIESCSISENICLSNFNESSLCIYNNDYKNYCSFLWLFYDLLILFILSVTTYSISYSLISNLSNQIKNNYLGYIFIITLLINIPAFILWFTYSQYLLFYLFSLILISFFSCVVGSAKKYVKHKNNQQSDYYSLN